MNCWTRSTVNPKGIEPKNETDGQGSGVATAPPPEYAYIIEICNSRGEWRRTTLRFVTRKSAEGWLEYAKRAYYASDARVKPIRQKEVNYRGD